MDIHLFFAFCLAFAILVILPGPIVTLVVANSLNHGTRTGFATVAGANVGNTLLLAAIGVGLVTIFSLLSAVFTVVRWIGAAYLIWLGVNAWRVDSEKAGAALSSSTPRSAGAVFLQGFVVAATNPKAITFFIAFLPQFIDPRLPVAPQLLALGAASIVIELISDGTYAALAGRVRGWLTAPGRRRLQGRITGTLLIGTGATLLLIGRGT